MALIFVGSSISGGMADSATRAASGADDPIHIQRIKDVFHVTEFGGLALLLIRALRLQGHRYALTTGFLIAAAYGICDELYQYYVPNRHPGVDDVVRNFVGALIGAVIIRIGDNRSRDRLCWAGKNDSHRSRENT